MAATLDAKLRLNSAEFSGGLDRAVRESQASVGKLSTQFNSLRNILSAGAVGMFSAGIVKGLFDASVQAESLQAAMTATAGSVALGKRQLEQVRTLAGEIGLEVQGAAKAMIMFQSAGMSAAEASKTIKAGYNAILSSGGGAAEFSRFSVAIQQLRTSPKILQEELNQLREALPTTARLMQETFGATRSEDLQKLNINGREFVDMMLMAMQKLPEIGDTMGKQLGRFQVQLEQFKAAMGEAMKPVAGDAMEFLSYLMRGMSNEARRYADWSLMAQGIDPDAIRAETNARADREERIKAERRALDDFNKSLEKERELRNAGIASQFENDIAMREGEKKAEEVFAKIAAEDKKKQDTEAAAFWANEDAMYEGIKAGEAFWKGVQDAEHEAMWDNTEAMNEGIAAGEAFWTAFYEEQKEAAAAAKMGIFEAIEQNEAKLPGLWNEEIRKAGMTPAEKKAERAQERETGRNAREAADKITRKQMSELKKQARENTLDNIKNNKPFFDEEGTKRKLRDQNRIDAAKAAQGAAQTLLDIKVILNTLATA